MEGSDIHGGIFFIFFSLDLFLIAFTNHIGKDKRAQKFGDFFKSIEGRKSLFVNSIIFLKNSEQFQQRLIEGSDFAGAPGAGALIAIQFSDVVEGLANPFAVGGRDLSGGLEGAVVFLASCAHSRANLAAALFERFLTFFVSGNLRNK